MLQLLPGRLRLVNGINPRAIYHPITSIYNIDYYYARKEPLPVCFLTFSTSRRVVAGSTL